MDFPKVILLTATTGHPYLKECLNSVQEQTYPNLQHIVICDGPQFEKNVDEILQSIPPSTILL